MSAQVIHKVLAIFYFSSIVKCKRHEVSFKMNDCLELVIHLNGSFRHKFTQLRLLKFRSI